MDQSARMPISVPPLPRALVLSYVTGAATPTRVRRVASGAVGIIGGMFALAGFFILAVVVLSLIGALREYFHPVFLWVPGPARTGIVVYLWWWAGEHFVGIVLLGFTASVAAVTIACVRPIRRGRKGACLLALVPVTGVMVIVGLIGALMGAVGLLMGFGWGKVGKLDPQPVYLVWVLGAVAAVPVVVLIYDLCGYLRWIARTPITEKPGVSFLPGAGRVDGGKGVGA